MYVVFAASPLLEYDVVFAVSVAICEKLTPSVDRSTLKPASFVELSVHARSIRLEETAIAVRLEGAAGPCVVVAEAVFE